MTKKNKPFEIFVRLEQFCFKKYIIERLHCVSKQLVVYFFCPIMVSVVQHLHLNSVYLEQQRAAE